MFGRKRKKQEENTGLAGLGSAPMPAVSVPSSPAPPASPSTPAAPANPFTAISIGQTQGDPAMLSQILNGQGPIGELLAQIKADPQGFRDRMIAQAQAMGASTFVMTPQGMTPLSAGHGPATGAQHVDVVEELTKAAELHDKGVLNDAEFETLKKKLLGE
jgi:hypothetical protein